MDDLVKLLKKFGPKKIRVFMAGEDSDGGKVHAVPNVRNRWQHILRVLEGVAWVKLELLDKQGDVLCPIERELPVDAMDLTPPDELTRAAGQAGFQINALAGLAQLFVKAIHLGMEEQRKGTEQVLGAAISILNITASRLEGMERAADKMMRQAFENAKAAGLISGAGDEGSGKAFETFVQMVQQGRADRLAEAQKQTGGGGQPPPGPNGQSR